MLAAVSAAIQPYHNRTTGHVSTWPGRAAAVPAAGSSGDIKAEVIYCVGGVISPLLLNIALHGLEEAERSAMAFMRGVRTLQSTVRIPAPARTASNAVVKLDLG